jgi:ParB family chromosome partitioning protein
LAKNDVRNSIKLTSVDELFSTEESRANSQREKVLEIPLSEISDFPNHPFKVKADEAMLEMADSVKQYGVLVPALCDRNRMAAMKWLPDTGAKKQVSLQARKQCPVLSVN